jgi:FkbM family methyltransferase
LNAVEVETNVGDLWAHPDDEVTKSMHSHGFWELHVVRLLESRLRPGMTFVDVGAFIGYFTVLASRLVGPRGRVFAFEPDAGSVALLQANLHRHRCTNVSVFAVAAWSGFRPMRLTQHDGNRGSAEIGAGKDGTDVRAAPLDALINGPVDVMKIDAEGSDPAVVWGARRLLADCPLVVTEFWPRETFWGLEPREILERYCALGRELSIISVSGELEPASVEEALAREEEYVALALTPAGGVQPLAR